MGAFIIIEFCLFGVCRLFLQFYLLRLIWFKKTTDVKRVSSKIRQLFFLPQNQLAKHSLMVLLGLV